MTSLFSEGPLVVDLRVLEDRLELRGADRARFLNGLVTAAVKDLTPGTGTHGFFTARKGGVLANFTLLVHDDRYWLALPAGRGAVITEHLEKYVLADRVTISPSAEAPVAVVGAGAERALEALFGEVPASPWCHRPVVFAGHAGTLQNHPQRGAPAWQLWLPEAELDAVLPALQEALGARVAGVEELEVLRVVAGIPRWGLDYGEDNLPQETGLESAISYTKGCYLGQEIVARVHYRGGVQRTLVGLRLVAPAAGGAELSFEERPVGTLGSVVTAPGVGVIALAIVHRRGAEVGTRLLLPDGSPAEVVPLPFDLSHAPKEGT